MTNKKLYIRLSVSFLLVFVIGLGFNEKVLSANSAPAQTNQHYSLPLARQDWSGLIRGAAPYSEYTEITDNEEKIKVQVPTEWSDIETGVWNFRGKNVGVFVAASADLGNFYSTRSQPGVLIGVSRSLARTYNKEGLLGLERRELSRQCVHKGRFDYQNQFYSGQYDHFANCSGTPGVLIFTAASADQKSLILIRIVVVSEADLQAVDTIMSTFQVLGDPERDEHQEN
jgi:hypothetical protein